MERDLTSGSVWKNIVYFSLPYLLSYFLQTLYGLADLFIVGQFDGVASTTAVSIGSQVMHMLTVMIVGLAMGATVRIGRAVGAKDDEMARESVGNTAALFMGLSVAGDVPAAARREWYFGVAFHAGRGGRRHARLSDGLLHRHSVYHGV